MPSFEEFMAAQNKATTPIQTAAPTSFEEFMAAQSGVTEPKTYGPAMWGATPPSPTKDIISDTLKATGKDIGKGFEWFARQLGGLGEAGVKAGAGLAALPVGAAAALATQAATGDWEKAGEVSGKITSAMVGPTLLPESKLYEPLMPPVQQIIEAIAPNEPKTQAALGTAAGIGMLAAPPLIRRARQYYSKGGKPSPAPKVEPEIEYVEPTGAAPHAAEGGWSPESIARAKTTKFFMYDKATKTTRPLAGVDAIDTHPGPGRVKLQETKGRLEVSELGQGVSAEEGIAAKIDANKSMALSKRVPVSGRRRFFPRNAPELWKDVMEYTGGQGISPSTGMEAEWSAIPWQLKNRKSPYKFDTLAQELASVKYPGLENGEALRERLVGEKMKTPEALGEKATVEVSPESIMAPAIDDIWHRIGRKTGEIERGFMQEDFASDRIAQDKIYGLFSEVKNNQRPYQSAVAEAEKILGGYEKNVEYASGLRIPGLGGKATQPKPTFQFTDPAIETRFQKAKGVPKPTLPQHITDMSVKLWHDITRTYEQLPNRPEFAETKMALKTLEKQRPVAIDTTLRELRDIMGHDDPVNHDLFSRKVILDDLAHEAGAGRDLPFGFTKDSVATEAARVNAEVANNPTLQQSIVKRTAAWDKLKTDYADAMREVGYDVEGRLTKEDYYRHQVLEHAQQKGVKTTGGRIHTPTGRGFMKQRHGSELDINTDYLQAETEVMAQMRYDVEVARTLKRINDSVGMADKLKAEAKAKGLKDWHEIIPETHTTFQPREGSIFYLAKSIPERIAEEIMNGNLDDIGVVADNLRQTMAVGGKRREWVLPKEVVATLEGLVKNKPDPGGFAKGMRKVQRGWKQWILGSPRRFPKYSARNLSGDLEAAFVGNMSSLKKTPRAISEVYNLYMTDKPMSPEMKEFFRRGGLETTLQAQELGDIKNLKMFSDLYEQERAGVFRLPEKAWKGYWQKARIANDMRESVLRYANFLDYAEQMKLNPKGMPKNFGASLREEVMALPDVNDRAFRLSNELIGAYDEISVMGNRLREYWYPFWSWKELNFRRYVRLMKNAVLDGKTAGKVGKIAAAKAPIMALRVGRFALKASGVWAMLQAWNNLRYPELENGLSEEQKTQPHIILGKDKQGKTIYFSRLGMLGDFLEWFGLDSLPGAVDKLASGRVRPKDVALDMAKAPVNTIFQGMSPFYKAPFEALLRKELFPDAFNPRTIRDRGQYLAKQLGLMDEYTALTKIPGRPYKESLPGFVVYKEDPEEVAYREVRDMVSDYMRTTGRRSAGEANITPRGNALYYAKLARKFGDKESEQRFLKEYATLFIGEEGLHGTAPETTMKKMASAIASSYKSLFPLYSLPKGEYAAFGKTLDDDDRKRLALAIKFYNETLIGGSNYNPLSEE